MDLWTGNALDRKSCRKIYGSDSTTEDVRGKRSHRSSPLVLPSTHSSQRLTMANIHIQDGRAGVKARVFTHSLWYKDSVCRQHAIIASPSFIYWRWWSGYFSDKTATVNCTRTLKTRRRSIRRLLIWEQTIHLPVDTWGSADSSVTSFQSWSQPNKKTRLFVAFFANFSRIFGSWWHNAMTEWSGVDGGVVGNRWQPVMSIDTLPSLV